MGRDDHSAGLDVASRAIFKFPRRARLLQYRLSAELDVSLAAVVRRDDSEDIVKDENFSSTSYSLTNNLELDLNFLNYLGGRKDSTQSQYFEQQYFEQ